MYLAYSAGSQIECAEGAAADQVIGRYVMYIRIRKQMYAVLKDKLILSGVPMLQSKFPDHVKDIV